MRREAYGASAVYEVLLVESACRELRQLDPDRAVELLHHLKPLRDAPLGAGSDPLSDLPSPGPLRHRLLSACGYDVVYTVDDHRRQVVVVHIDTAV
ncbi:type II toxin-antitoxin system RelE/ParE family toxin [Kitasatospora sp. NPDC058965]|uniref:type II toxin-antitoxin system RelE family toxin n=1 Tax=Kitasatospora sp. NPDC058965 TaxID=3346682 RepID=UPI00368C2676